MAKSSNKSNNKSNVKSNSSSRTSGRPKPMTPKAGFTVSRRRYGEGGKA